MESRVIIYLSVLNREGKRTVIGYDAAELLVVLGEGGGYGIYENRDRVIGAVGCGSYSWQVKAGDSV
jgi:hypothetical protein